MSDDDVDAAGALTVAPKTRRPPKHEHTDINQFCWLVATGMPLGEAARQAAFRISPDDPMPPPMLFSHRAHSLMRRPNVQETIARLHEQVQANASIKFAVSRESIIRDLLTVKERCMQAEPVRDAEGNPTGEWTFNARGAVAAIELIGKEFGMFVQRHKHEHTLDDLSDAQLIERAKSAALKRAAIEASIAGDAGGADRGDSGDGGVGAATLN